MRKIYLAALLALWSGTAWAECPAIGPAPRTGNSKASEFAASKGWSLDDEGILLYDYGARYGNLGKYRNPYFNSNYAYMLYRDYLATECKDEELRAKFLGISDFFVKTADRKNGIAVWRYTFPNETFEFESGWISGIGQARIAGVLYRAYAVSGEEIYRDVAEEAMESNLRSPKDGGVATEDGDVVWIEEAADPHGASYKILNGHITALGGIQDFAKISGEKKWWDLFYRGVEAVRRDISKFDTGAISYYSLASPKFRQIAARREYNSLHVAQLLWLYQETNDPKFLEWAMRFQAYELNTDVYTAKHSVNAKTHGPDQSGGFYGNHYWSDNQFPTWLQVDVGKPDFFKNIAVHGSSFTVLPKDYTVSARLNGQWKVIAKDRGNTDIRRTINFTYPVEADAFRLDITAGTSKQIVGLMAFMPGRIKPKYAAVPNECNYRISANRYNYDLALDDDPSEWMRIYCPGWVTLPVDGAKTMLVSARGKKGTKFTVEYSDDLKTWGRKETIGLTQGVILPEAKYVRLSFDLYVTAIDKIKLFR